MPYDITCLVLKSHQTVATHYSCSDFEPRYDFFALMSAIFSTEEGWKSIRGVHLKRSRNPVIVYSFVRSEMFVCFTSLKSKF